MSNHHAQIPGRGAIKFDLFAAESRQEMIDRMSDPLVAFETQFDFGALAAKVDREVPRPVGHRPVNLSASIQVIAGVYHIENVNTYDSRLQPWIRRIHGLAAKYLTHYLDLHQWL